MSQGWAVNILCGARGIHSKKSLPGTIAAEPSKTGKLGTISCDGSNKTWASPQLSEVAMVRQLTGST